MRRRKQRSSLGLWISVIVIALLIVGGLFFWKIYSVKNSAEFNPSTISIYFFINSSKFGNDESDNLGSSNLNNIGYFIIVDGSKRSVYITRVKDHSYNSQTKQQIDFSNPKLSESLLADMLGIKAIYDYYVVFNHEKFNEFASSLGINASNFEDLFDKLSQRGLKVLDYLKLDGVVKKLRPETSLTSEGLAKLIYSFGTYSVRMLDLPTMTENPLEIKVLNKTIHRLYIDLEKLNQMKEEIRR
ncbi:MAG: hypothetical protein PWP54_71 [Thermosipho sp. (in: thermotogales)]|nr:hypothetical protein [Thermosipho sp. (in: thermotogales)]MDN5324361.1 hypothetical protein [Thermosipho sp. (in: thermotogales)]